MKNTIYILTAIAILGIIAVYTIPDSKKDKIATITAQTDANQAAIFTPELIGITATDQGSLDENVVADDTLKDGTYIGDAKTNQFGSVEVSIVVSSGEIINIELLQSPDSDARSMQISQYATNILIETTLNKQSADLDIISGATYTSVSYIDSLQSALDQAKL